MSNYLITMECRTGNAGYYTGLRVSANKELDAKSLMQSYIDEKKINLVNFEIELESESQTDIPIILEILGKSYF